MRQLLFTLFAIIIFFGATAQKNKTPKAKLTENTIVRDTAGTIYPYDIWRRFAMNSNYSLMPVDPNSETSDFVIKRLSPEQRKMIMEKMPKPRETNYFKTGASFSNFKERDIEGNKYNLKELRGKVVVLNYWFINCPPCQMEIPELNTLVEEFKENKDVVFIAIALDQKYALQDFLRTMPFNYNIIENGRYLAEDNRVKSFPTHVVLDKEGKIVFHTTGLSKNTVYWVKKSLEDALAKTLPLDVVKGK
ncbi:MAG TPA: TlpA disulfide reductase family protein [Chitinophagaceae bacterium]|nr:TlpA disulfide reductase family protein [Chitinophagaceae bacterium]